MVFSVRRFLACVGDVVIDVVDRSMNSVSSSVEHNFLVAVVVTAASAAGVTEGVTMFSSFKMEVVAVVVVDHHHHTDEEKNESSLKTLTTPSAASLHEGEPIGPLKLSICCCCACCCCCWSW